MANSWTRPNERPPSTNGPETSNGPEQSKKNSDTERPLSGRSAFYYLNAALSSRAGNGEMETRGGRRVHWMDSLRDAGAATGPAQPRSSHSSAKMGTRFQPAHRRGLPGQRRPGQPITKGELF